MWKYVWESEGVNAKDSGGGERLVPRWRAKTTVARHGSPGEQWPYKAGREAQA